jgi:hypothetical protein
MEVAVGSPSDKVRKDEGNIMQPRDYAGYESGSCPEWLKGLLPAPQPTGKWVVLESSYRRGLHEVSILK